MSAKSWKEAVREKCEIRRRLIEPYLNNVNGERAVFSTVLDIDNVGDLTNLLASGKVSAHDAIRSYVRR